MLPSHKLELEILRNAQWGSDRDHDGWPTTMGDLGNIVRRAMECTDTMLEDAMKRLHEDRQLRLRKLVNKFVEYEDFNAGDEEFFYRGDFWLLIPPQGRPYYEALLAKAADEPKPKPPIGFSAA